MMRNLSVGFLASLITILLTVATISSMDAWLRVSVGACALGIPLFALNAFAISFLTLETRRNHLPWLGPLEAVGLLIGLTAFTGVIGHIHWICALMFFAAATLALVLGGKILIDHYGSEWDES